MKCKECESRRLKSKVISSGFSRSMLGWEPHFDENGKEHSHDPNAIISAYKCSNKHFWNVKSYPRCWCGWSNEKQEDNIK